MHIKICFPHHLLSHILSRCLHTVELSTSTYHMSISDGAVKASQTTPSIGLKTFDGKRAQIDLSSKARLSEHDSTSVDVERTRSPLPEILYPPLQRWNEPRGNIARFAAAFFSMFVIGLSDAAYGALLPYVCLINYDAMSI